MSEILKSFWVTVYAWALPSALALGATWLLLLPQLGVLNNSLAEAVSLFLALTTALAISLSSASTQLYRLLEGYSWPHRLQEWGLRRQHARKKALQDEVVGEGWRHGIAVENLDRYPLDDSQILPTKFGNAIRAFETYGKTRFNMDSQTLWHELLSVAPKYIQLEVDSTRSTVDFFVALVFLSVFFGFACLVVGVIEHFKIDMLLLSIPAFSLAFLWQALATRAVDAWRHATHALVNLGRVKVADSLGLTFPASLEDEKTMWGLVTKYAYYPNRKYGEALDAYRKTPTEISSRASDENQCDERSEQASADY